MNGSGWIVGGYLAYVGLAIGAALFLALAVAVVRGQRRLRTLEERLARAERDRERPPVVPEAELDLAMTPEEPDDALVPTPLGPVEDDEPNERVDRQMFWDQVLRESVVRAAAIGHGVRAVLDPRTRNRIRFEVRQEIKSARKQRRADERAAVRQIRQERLEDAS